MNKNIVYGVDASKCVKRIKYGDRERYVFRGMGYYRKTISLVETMCGIILIFKIIMYLFAFIIIVY